MTGRAQIIKEVVSAYGALAGAELLKETPDLQAAMSREVREKAQALQPDG